MRVLFLSDSLFTRFERDMIARLAIGLADEGVTVAWAVPAHAASRLNSRVFLPVIPFVEKRLGLSPARRAAMLLSKSREALRGLPEVVHFFGGNINRIGAEVTRAAGAVPAFELWRPGMESSVRVAMNRISGPGYGQSPPRSLLVTPNDDLREKALRVFPDSIVRTIPWGVYPLSEPPTRETGTICILLLGPGRDQKSWQAAFEAAVRSVKASDRIHLFADAETTRRLRLWGHARRAGILDRLTLIDQASMERELVLNADIILQPDARGELRTILLDAMAARVAIVAAADPRSDVLEDGRTARLVVDATEQQWNEAIEVMIQNDAARRRLTESAREFVREHHKASRQIAALVDAYEWVAGDAERIESNAILGPPGV